MSDPIDSPYGYIIFHRVLLKSITASHILISYKGALRSTSTRSYDDAYKIAVEIYQKAQSNKNFEALARNYSDGPSRKNGGNLGKFSQGQMVKEFDEKAFSLKIGEISNPVETKFGSHIIKRLK